MKALFITILVVFFLHFFLYDFSMASKGGARTGGWMNITNVNDPKVIEIGKFAVDEHNKIDKASLKFVKVVKGKSQVVAGMNYDLTISAVDDKLKNNYTALVWDKLDNSKELESFEGPL